MYFILITQLLMTSLAIGVEELHEADNNSHNRTKFLPYTLKTEVDKEANQKNKQALSLYEEKSGIIKPPENNNWKMLTSFLSSRPTLNNQEIAYLCKQPNSHSQHLQNSFSLFGSFNFYLAQTAFLLIHLAVLTYILFGSVTLFHRLLSLHPPTVNAIGEGFDGNFYKGDL